MRQLPRPDTGPAVDTTDSLLTLFRLGPGYRALYSGLLLLLLAGYGTGLVEQGLRSGCSPGGVADWVLGNDQDLQANRMLFALSFRQVFDEAWRRTLYDVIPTLLIAGLLLRCGLGGKAKEALVASLAILALADIAGPVLVFGFGRAMGGIWWFAQTGQAAAAAVCAFLCLRDIWSRRDAGPRFHSRVWGRDMSQFFTYRGFSLRSAPFAIRSLITLFIVMTSLGLAVGMLNYQLRTGLTVRGSGAWYLGGGPPDSNAGLPLQAKSPLELMDATHPHLFSQTFLFFILGHFLALCRVSSRLKVATYVAAFAGVAADTTSPWLIRFVSAGFSYLQLAGHAVELVAFACLIAVPLLQMWGRPRGANLGRTGDEEAPGTA